MIEVDATDRNIRQEVAVNVLSLLNDRAEYEIIAEEWHFFAINCFEGDWDSARAYLVGEIEDADEDIGLTITVEDLDALIAWIDQQ